MIQSSYDLINYTDEKAIDQSSHGLVTDYRAEKVTVQSSQELVIKCADEKVICQFLHELVTIYTDGNMRASVHTNQL